VELRELVKASIGSYRDHKPALEYPDKVESHIAERASRIGWQNIPAQWIQTHDHERAENSFFRINQGGTKIDPTERRIINARASATALASRAIMRGGSGHNYWDKFDAGTQDRIESSGKEVHDLLFDPTLTLPVKTSDIPNAGHAAPKCPTCGGLLHRNGMQAGHREHRRSRGRNNIANAQMQHPFCNSTVEQ
jgi:hypothetical protein